MSTDTNALDWFEISVSDMARAKAFYSGMIGMEMQDDNLGPVQMAYFPTEMGSGKLGGALAKSDNHKPGTTGAIVYLNANPDLNGYLSKVESLGGKVLMPKMSIGQYGHMAMFMDTEGNAIGLHSNQ